MDSRDIQAVVELWDQVTVAIVGIGKSPFAYQPEPTGKLQFGEFYLHPDEIQELKDKGTVGDINARFFDAQGQEQYLKIHQRTVGMSLAKLSKVPLVIGVAGGPGKLEAIRGALRGNHLDVLITDQWTAQHLVEDSVQ
jgi:DNA-binding transcriptional regulator LsrR (DeoR family)